MHPELEALISFVDGALAGGPGSQVEKHLERCDPCRSEVVRLRLAMVQREGKWQVPPVEEVLAGIRRWAARQGQQASASAVKVRVAREISQYLGARSSDRILQKASDQDVLSTIEPVLADFLGRRAAQSLVSRVVDRAIMQI